MSPARTRNFVRTDRCAHAAAADGHAALHAARSNGLCERNDEIRIVIGGVQAVSSKIDDIMPRRAKVRDEFLLQAKSAVIGGNAYTHGPLLFVDSYAVFRKVRAFSKTSTNAR